MQPKNEEKKKLWMLFDPSYTLVDQAELETREGDTIAVLRPVGENAKEALRMHIVLFSLVENPSVIYRGEVGARRGGKLYLENVARMDADTGHHLRVRMRFHTKLFCARDGRPFRVPVTSIDLSAGGIAFSCPKALEIGEPCEIVIPVTAEMLVVNIQILRREAVTSQTWQYGARFLDLAHEEETMIRQAIFSEQWRRGKCRVMSGTYKGN